MIRIFTALNKLSSSVRK